MRRERGGATFFGSGMRRAALWREWNGQQPSALFVGLNPSSAGGIGSEDHTTRKLRVFCERWGMGGYLLENLFDYVATHPRALYDSRLILERPGNLERIVHAAHGARIVVCCWGRHGALRGQSLRLLALMRGTPTWKKLRAFRINADGSPAHPLMLPYTTALVTYNPKES